MAMTKQNCFDAGVADFLCSVERPEGTSWQAVARQAGWDDAKAQKDAQTAAAVAAMAPMAIAVAEGFKALDAVARLPQAYEADLKAVRKPVVQHPAMHHIQQLQQQAIFEPSAKRHVRLLHKAQMLAIKWADRGVTL